MFKQFQEKVVLTARIKTIIQHNHYLHAKKEVTLEIKMDIYITTKTYSFQVDGHHLYTSAIDTSR